MEVVAIEIIVRILWFVESWIEETWSQTGWNLLFLIIVNIFVLDIIVIVKIVFRWWLNFGRVLMRRWWWCIWARVF